MDIQQIAVIGAGTMGNGIAHVCIQHGFQVTLVDISIAALEKAQQQIEKNMERQEKKGVLSSEQRLAALQRLTLSTHLEGAVANCQLVIEAATENPTIKRQLFENIDKAAPADCILATNTSSISITSLAAATKRPGKVIGMHFMNPVPVMKLVEVINAYQTEAAVTQSIVELSKQLEKIPCVANDYPGFIANRILMPMLNEAIYCLQEGVGTVDSIDNIMKLGMGHPMGPLQLADFIGLDVCKSILDVMYAGFGQAKYAPCTLLVNMVMAGKLGIKSGEGFYDYSAGTDQKQVSIRFR
ncbi:MAG: 3-hydroxyacyl-CoA dehydrogenase NAD-binding domain-containing protein [Chitinophagia bacterium]